MADYAQLQADILDWMARADLPAASFITLAEAEMNRILRLQSMETQLTTTPVGPDPNNRYSIAFPSGFLDMIQIRQGGFPLEYVSNRQFTERYEAGWEQMYTIQDEKILVPGAPDVIIDYRGAIPALSLTVPTNWFTANAYDALLYLSLDHASAYVGNENPDYRQRAMIRLDEIQQFDDRSRMSGGPLVMHG